MILNKIILEHWKFDK